MQPSDIIATLPATLKARRTERGLSLRSAAALMGIPFNTLYRWECGQIPSHEALIAVLRWLEDEGHD